jgi:hypothetical protein
MLVPEDELLADAYRMRWQGALITLATLAVVPAAWLADVESFGQTPALHWCRKRMRFAVSISTFRGPRRSPVLEIDQLSVSMARMKDALASFFQITDSLSAETRFVPLLERVLFETVKIGQAQAGLIYLREGDGDRMEPQGLVIQRCRATLSSFDIQRPRTSEPAEP